MNKFIIVLFLSLLSVTCQRCVEKGPNRCSGNQWILFLLINCAHLAYEINYANYSQKDKYCSVNQNIFHLFTSGSKVIKYFTYMILASHFVCFAKLYIIDELRKMGI